MRLMILIEVFLVGNDNTGDDDESHTEIGGQIVVTGKSGTDAGPVFHLKKLSFGKFGVHGGNDR